MYLAYKKTKHIFLFSLLITTTPNIQAQKLSFGGLFPLWNQVGVLHSKWRYDFLTALTISIIEIDKGLIENPKNTLQTQLQAGIGYAHKNNVNFFMDYLYRTNNPFNVNSNHEHRIFQQAAIKHNIYKSSISHRLRLEERFIQNTQTNEYPLYLRLRFQIAFTMPLQGKSLDAKQFYVNASNEFFINMYNNVNQGYTDNWLYAGIGYRFQKTLSMQLGYLMQTGIINVQKKLQTLHLLQLMLITNF